MGVILGVLGMIGALALLAGVAWVSQRPAALQKVPLLGPSATPTPVASENIILTSPKSGEYIQATFVVQGKARVFENVVNIRLKEKLSGKVYGETTAMTDATEAGTFGDFQTGIQLTNPNLKSGTEFILEVYQSSAKDGSEYDKVSVPVVFKPI